MNKSQLIEQTCRRLTGKNAVTRAQAAEAVEAILDIVREALVTEQSVSLSGFGTFEVRRLAARPGRNPRTGEPVAIPERNNVKFRPAKALRESVN